MIKKCMLAAAVLTLTMVWATGCGSEQKTESGSTALMTEDQSAGDTAEDTSHQGQDGDADDGNGTKSEGTENTGPDSAATENSEAQNSGLENNESGNDKAEGRELIFIGGTVRSASQNSFVISRTLLEESSNGRGSVVVMPEAGSPEEELVTVRCMESTVFERWTIQGGGADILKEEAVFSEIREGTGLETQGYFDGNEFVAEKVVIEIYP